VFAASRPRKLTAPACLTSRLGLLLFARPPHLAASFVSNVTRLVPLRDAAKV
jgi:hypothetical protein